MKKKIKWADHFWDALCIISILGIWPRFIEPHLLQVTRVPICFSTLPTSLEGLKLLHFSDLHWSHSFSSSFAKKIEKKIKQLSPDLICFTGDFISRSLLEEDENLKQFLSSLRAPLGVFAILGNHDYERFVTVNQKGEYDVDESSSPNIVKGFQRLFEKSKPFTGQMSEEAKKVGLHRELMLLLEKANIKVLNNETHSVRVGETFINLCGLGDLSVDQFQPKQAFKNYDTKYPGIILSHNPDSIPLLEDYPGFLILSGHTHGGQINLPWIADKLTKMVYPQYKRGLKKLRNKWAYINRGVGGVMKFRWFSLPELTLFTLKAEEK